MRKYQPIWELIKKNQETSLAAPIASHARIINAVRKEKSADLGWKLLLSETGKRYKLKEYVDGTLITFFLVKDTSLYLNTL